MQVYVVMNAYGIVSIYGKKSQAEKRINYLHAQYATHHWIIVWDVEGEDTIKDCLRQSQKQRNISKYFGEDEDNDKY